ncbi:MAG: DNA repair protein RecN [Rhodospirillales bacterium]|nr:DNA repair protein RecN [Rhodospirillales bacterium]
MLRSLSIRNVVLIDRLDLGFDGGLSVLTGETGSGKSILLDSLGLAIGVRADSDLVRKGADQSAVTAEFELNDSSGINLLLAEQGIETAANLVLRRVLSADGRSRAFVNDQPVSVALLRRVSELLVEVHGQLETHGLLDPATHHRFVDVFGGLEPELEKTAGNFGQWREAQATYNQARQEVEKAKKDEEFLRHAVEELRRLDPQTGEEEELSAKRLILMNSEQLIQNLNEASEDLNQGIGVESALQGALQKITKVSDKAGGRLDEAVAALERALVETGEGVAALEAASGSMDLDPRQLEQLEERLFALRGLARKHEVTADELAALRVEMERQLAALEGGAANLDALAKEVDNCRAGYIAAAETLTKKRQAVGEKLDKAVTGELAPLKLEAATFHTKLDPLEESDWNEFGREYVTFEVKTNPNTAAGPLHRVASGGELARITLALKVVLADADSVPTIIFDEVDAGIGGAAAAAVGERLAQLARDHQVLVVTHSPQVAARGDSHWRIVKTGDADGNITNVDRLVDDHRTEEVARMLAGAKITDEARSAAGILLDGVPGEDSEAAE